ncbi:MAG TPA: riboflavin biosynthesis protein RibF, partial [Candidatus Coproplasma excrementavium]|nr:riboflavin biosynthesis protein RibF [Candidatus Coproplasma excrementavium]
MLNIVNYNKDEYDFPALIVLGCFDAIHIGHQELLKKAKLQAKINGLDLGVMMFAEGKGGRQVFTFEERLAMLAPYNVKFALRIDYTEDFKKTTAQQFLSNIEEHINIKGYMSGKDFRFGAGAKGKSSTLKNFAEDEDNGVWYMSVKDVTADGEKVSTTLIKQYIDEGKIQKAEQLLGRKYFVTGKVCEGHGRGAKLVGFPTANIMYPENKVLVAPGVYGVEAEIDGTVYKGVANCGARPTFGEDAYVMEAYFEGLSEDLYGKEITVKFLNYIRGIKKFENAEELSEQIA